DHEIYFTKNGNKVFCIFSRWSSSLDIDLLPDEKVKKVTLLGYSGEIKWKIVDNHRLTVEIPRLTIDELPCLNAWTLKIE
ncbi:MAG: alpha-L-fucosidase C-terminal domain-containing protein, partial [Mariniphaga sp.]